MRNSNSTQEHRPAGGTPFALLGAEARAAFSLPALPPRSAPPPSDDLTRSANAGSRIEAVAEPDLSNSAVAVDFPNTAIIPSNQEQSMGASTQLPVSQHGALVPHAAVSIQMACGGAAYAGLSEARQAAANLAALTAEERERMLLEQLPSVRFIARRIHERLPAHVEMDDLISAGVLGLIDACAKFDNKKNVQFKSYAQFRIRGAILDSLRTLDWSPRELRRKGRAVEEAIRSLSGKLSRAPQEPEIAQEMGLGLGEFQQLLGELKGLEIGSLHMERSEDSGEDELAYLPGNPEDDPLFQCMQGEMKQHLADAIDELPEKERLVLTLYYYEELTMKEIGLTLGVVESRVSQIHSSAVLRLRTSLRDLAGPGAKPVKAKAGKASRARREA